MESTSDRPWVWMNLATGIEHRATEQFDWSEALRPGVWPSNFGSEAQITEVDDNAEWILVDELSMMPTKLNTWNPSDYTGKYRWINKDAMPPEPTQINGIDL